MRLEVALPDYEPAQLIYWLGYTQAAPLLRSKFLHPSSGSCEPNYREERLRIGDGGQQRLLLSIGIEG